MSDERVEAVAKANYSDFFEKCDRKPPTWDELPDYEKPSWVSEAETFLTMLDAANAFDKFDGDQCLWVRECNATSETCEFGKCERPSCPRYKEQDRALDKREAAQEYVPDEKANVRVSTRVDVYDKDEIGAPSPAADQPVAERAGTVLTELWTAGEQIDVGNPIVIRDGKVWRAPIPPPAPGAAADRQTINRLTDTELTAEINNARMQERAAVVKWLRECAVAHARSAAGYKDEGDEINEKRFREIGDELNRQADLIEKRHDQVVARRNACERGAHLPTGEKG